MDYKQTAEKIIELVGGKENIQTHTHCMTRLRLVLKNVALAKEDELKKVPGIQGVVNKAGQYQIVIGPDVEQLYNELAPMIPNATAEKVVEENLDAEKESIWNRVLAFISGSITPTLPVLIGSGMISAILSLAANVFHVDTAGSTYTLLNTLANAAYTYLPVLVAFAAARRLKTNEYVAAFIILALCSPAITGVADLTIFGIPLTTVKYTSNIVPALLMVPVMAFIDRYVVKYSPKSIVSITRPLILALIMFPLTLLLLGPIGTWVGTILAKFCVWITSLGGISMAILSALHPLLVMVGMHTLITPLIVNEITTYGSSLLFSKALAGNLAIAGAALAVGLKAKKEENKTAGISTGITALLSVTEPALYGVLIRLKKPLIGALIGAAITGLFIGMFDIRAYATASCSLLTLPIFMGGESMTNFYLAVVAAIIAVILGFVATWFIGFKED
ncbi:MAG: PTS transporter subunit EIIC [Solobacterium sp.]|nr:PTS transporter subunit EIIC [Solobacterium sp.]MBR2668513.1 PTS transporter subunit EIIC [Solobacterium sp.]